MKIKSLLKLPVIITAGVIALTAYIFIGTITMKPHRR